MTGQRLPPTDFNMIGQNYRRQREVPPALETALLKAPSLAAKASLVPLFSVDD